tara:strand:+ start:656 stop:832 length:177 start_codon:yes stop_codon:yes gene_type:complete
MIKNVVRNYDAYKDIDIPGSDIPGSGRDIPRSAANDSTTFDIHFFLFVSSQSIKLTIN